MHLQLKPALRRVWREPGAVQIGLSARRGTVLDGLTARDAALLETLRAGLRLHPPPGGDDPRGRDLVRLLGDAGVLARRPDPPGRSASGVPAGAPGGLAADAAVWSVVHPEASDGWDTVLARGHRHVRVRGGGRLGTSVAAVLAGAGVGHVAVEDDRRVTPADLAPAAAGRDHVGLPRSTAAGQAVRRAAGRPEPPPTAAGDRPDLVVLVEHAAADAGAAEGLVRADVPHLSVLVRDDEVVVGPLVRPGAGPCLHCLDLHRTDRDPAWPSVLAQLLRPPPGTPEPEETALVTLAAGLAALQCLGHLDGVAEPASVGATLEIELPDGLVGRRAWPAHPRCGCHWPAAGPIGSATPPPGPPHGRSGPGPATMDA